MLNRVVLAFVHVSVIFQHLVGCGCMPEKSETGSQTGPTNALLLTVRVANSAMSKSNDTTPRALRMNKCVCMPHLNSGLYQNLLKLHAVQIYCSDEVPAGDSSLEKSTCLLVVCENFRAITRKFGPFR